MSTPENKKLWKAQAKRLRAARENAGFETQREAAKALDISEDTYNPWENGNRSFAKRADELAKAFGVSRTWLLEGGHDNYMEELFRALMEFPEGERETAAAAAIGVIVRLKKTA